MDVAAGSRGELTHGIAEIAQHRDLAEFGDSVDRVEPKPVETEFAQPIQRVLDGESAYLPYPIIDRTAPGGLRVRKEGGRIAAEIIAFRPEVIVDHVEKHHQPAQMRFVD